MTGRDAPPPGPDELSALRNLHDMADQLPIGMYRTTPAGRLLDANPALVSMLGFPDRDSFLAAQVADFYPDRDERARLLAKADREGGLQGVETQLRRKDGVLIWVRMNMSIARDAAGRPLFFTGTMEDITERRLAEEALWESQAQLKLLLEQLPAILWTTDRELRSTMSQGAGLAALNLHPNQLSGVSILDYLGTSDGDLEAIDAHRRALAGEAVSYQEDWGGRTYECHVRPLLGSDGAVAGTLGMALDVTDRRRVDQALQESEKRSRALYEKERAGREQAERLRAATSALGSSLELGDVLALILRELQGVVPYDTASVQELRGGFMEVIAGHGFVSLDGVVGVRFDVSADNPNREVFVSRRPVMVDNAPAAFPVFADGVHARTPVKSWIGIPLLFGDRLIGMLSVDKNEAGFYSREHAEMAEAFGPPAAIAIENARLYAAARSELEERKRVEDQFRQSQKMEAVGRLAGGIAHDFNNLLGVILGYTELAGRRLERDHPAQGKLEQVRKAAERAAALTGQLLAFSRKQVLVPEVLDLADVIADLSAMLHRVIGEDIELVTVVGPGVGAVRADRGQLGQAILNLAVNARDAMPRGGKLLIEAANVDLEDDEATRVAGLRGGAYARLAVTDTGSGMTADVRRQIFEPFFTTKAPDKGTGLGLSMVYGFLEQSGGHVTVDSDAGRGTTFNLYLPRVAGTVRPAPAPSAAPSSTGGSETVLLVEDAGSLRDMISEILNDHGYRVLEADSAERALVIAEEHEGPIALLLTDMVMPGMSGADLAERLRRRWPATRVLFMSGYTDDVMVQRGVFAEEAALIQKPFDSAALLRKIHETLGRAR